MSQDDTLEAFLNLVNREEDLNIVIYNRIAPINRDRLKRLVERYERVESLPGTQPSPRPSTVVRRRGNWGSRKNATKGRCFEMILKALLPNVFREWQRIQTATNELDFLVMLTPAALLIPCLREWGSSFVCEYKARPGYSGDWIQKLAGVLHLHNMKVGVILSRTLPGKTARSWETIRGHVYQGKFLVPLGMDDVRACLNGMNAVKLLEQRYISVKAHIKTATLI